MTDKAQHTLTPWKTRRNERATGVVFDKWDVLEDGPDGNLVAQFFGEQAETFAKQAVRAVNAHADLVAELQDAQQIMRDAAGPVAALGGRALLTSRARR